MLLSSGKNERPSKKLHSGRRFFHLCISNESDPDPEKPIHPNPKADIQTFEKQVIIQNLTEDKLLSRSNESQLS
jgi:hypothetical protein